jgi:hypothetical protein
MTAPGVYQSTVVDNVRFRAGFRGGGAGVPDPTVGLPSIGSPTRHLFWFQAKRNVSILHNKLDRG